MDAFLESIYDLHSNKFNIIMIVVIAFYFIKTLFYLIIKDIIA